jgi:hypothetical protein
LEQVEWSDKMGQKGGSGRLYPHSIQEERRRREVPPPVPVPDPEEKKRRAAPPLSG